MPEPGLISDLSRLRARWSRYENRIAKLEQEADEAMDAEAPAIIEKAQEARARLAETKLALLGVPSKAVGQHAERDCAQLRGAANNALYPSREVPAVIVVPDGSHD